jgi:hypothetical protein
MPNDLTAQQIHRAAGYGALCFCAGFLVELLLVHFAPPPLLQVTVQAPKPPVIYTQTCAVPGWVLMQGVASAYYTCGQVGDCVQVFGPIKVKDGGAIDASSGGEGEGGWIDTLPPRRLTPERPQGKEPR